MGMTLEECIEKIAELTEDRSRLVKNRHKHADVIIAWANGEEIEVDYEDGWGWQEAGEGSSFSTNHKYRIKPKIVKREGWVNVYGATEKHHIGVAHVSNAFATREEALEDAKGRPFQPEPTATVRIEWLEKQ